MGAGHQMPIKCQMFPMYLNIQFFSHFNQTVNGSGWLSPPDIPDLYFDLSFPVVVYCCLLLSPVAYCCLLLPTVVYCCLLLSNVRTFSTPLLLFFLFLCCEIGIFAWGEKGKGFFLFSFFYWQE